MRRRTVGMAHTPPSTNGHGVPDAVQPEAVSNVPPVDGASAREPGKARLDVRPMPRQHRSAAVAMTPEIKAQISEFAERVWTRFGSMPTTSLYREYLTQCSVCDVNEHGGSSRRVPDHLLITYAQFNYALKKLVFETGRYIGGAAGTDNLVRSARGRQVPRTTAKRNSHK
jgi:hypothetical protein